MVKPKQSSSSKKKPKVGSIDFKKIKRKVGRKLPPPKNATNTQVKSKAIVLPEQSVAIDRAGLAVNKKGLTLREILQQTSHHNAKTRKAALNGIKDLVLKHPSELELHKLAIIQKLRERICDSDKMVRETLYHILKTVIFRHLKEDISGAITSLMMAYIFNAMTHIAVDIRLTAFKYFELVVSCCPSSFFLYAEKVIDNYIDILRNNQIYLQDKSKLKNALGGLVQCLSLLAKKKGKDGASDKQNMLDQRCLYASESEPTKDGEGTYSVIKKLEDLVPTLVNCFLELAALIHSVSVIEAHSFECMLCALNCINVAVKIAVTERNTPQMSSGLTLSSLSNENDVRTTMLLLLKKLWESFPLDLLHDSTAKEDSKYFILNIKVVEIFLRLSDRINDNPFIFEKFFEFIEYILLSQDGSNLSSDKVLLQKHSSSIIPFFPGIVARNMGDWRNRLLKAFTIAFGNCKVNSQMTLVYLSAIEDMLLPMQRQGMLSSSFDYQEMVDYQIGWLRQLPKILLQLDDKHPSVSKVVLRLLLRIGQSSPLGSPLALHYDYIQQLFNEFFCNNEKVHCGTFLKLPSDCQELALCCLYYFSCLSMGMLESLASCCLRDDLEPNILLRVIEVLHSAYKAGHVQISDQIGFLVTLISRFRVLPEKVYFENDGKLSNHRIFKSLIRAVCSCLHEMGDNSLVLKLLLKIIFSGTAQKLPLDNLHGLLKMIISLNVRPIEVLDDGIGNISKCLSGYLIEATTSYLPQNVDVARQSDQTRIFQYFVKPCIFMLYGNENLLVNVLQMLDSFIMVDELSWDPLSKVHGIASILIFMLNDERLKRSLSPSTRVIHDILQRIHNLLASSVFHTTFEERVKLQNVLDQLKAKASELNA